MSENRYTFEEIGKYLCKNNIHVGIAIANNQELFKEIQKAANSGVRHIEIGSLDKNSRSFGFSSSTVEEIRQTGKLSSITFAVHASPYANPSGFINRGFSLEERNRAIWEIKAAADFACQIKDRDKDTVVVVHANSFLRPISDVDPGIFRDEAMKTYYLVDPATEAVVGAISEQDRVYIPQQAKDNRGSLWLEDRNRVPITDSVTEKPIPRLAVDENGRIRGEEISFAEYSRRMQKSGKTQRQIIKDFLYLQRVAEINAAYLRLLEAERTLSDAQKRREKLLDTFFYCQEIIQRSPQERWQHERSIPDRLSSLGIPVPQDTRSIIALLEDELAHNQRIIEAARHALTAGWPQFSNIVRELREISTLEEYGLEVLSEAIAEIAEYCISLSNSRGRIRLAIENLPQPQMYGSHVRELWEIIERSRGKLSSRLQKRGYSRSESNRLANEYIGATLDIAHLYLFKAFYRGNAFHGWLVSQTKDLARKGVIFDLHLSDNRGLDDDHLPLGEGNIPFREVLTVLADTGYSGYVVIEAGGARATRHTLDKLRILPMSTDDELMRGYFPRQAFGGLFSKDDPERPTFGKDEQHARF